MGDNLIRVIASKSKLDSDSRRGSIIPEDKDAGKSKAPESKDEKKTPPPAPDKEEPKKTSAGSETAKSMSSKKLDKPADESHPSTMTEIKDVSETSTEVNANVGETSKDEGEGDAAKSGGFSTCTPDDHFCLDKGSSLVSNQERNEPEAKTVEGKVNALSAEEAKVDSPSTEKPKVDVLPDIGNKFDLAQPPILLNANDLAKRAPVTKLNSEKGRLPVPGTNMPILKAVKEIPMASLMYEDRMVTEQMQNKRANLVMNDMWGRKHESDIKQGKLDALRTRQLPPRSPFKDQSPVTEKEIPKVPPAIDTAKVEKIIKEYQPRDEPSLDVLL